MVSWSLVIGFVIILSMIGNLIMSGNYIFALILVLADGYLAYYGKKQHENKDDHRISKLLKTSVIDLKRKDYFDL